ncbi:unnamed protein product, partial [Trichogramma brassicae]
NKTPAAPVHQLHLDESVTQQQRTTNVVTRESEAGLSNIDTTSCCYCELYACLRYKRASERRLPVHRTTYAHSRPSTRDSTTIPLSMEKRRLALPKTAREYVQVYTGRKVLSVSKRADCAFARASLHIKYRALAGFCKPRRETSEARSSHHRVTASKLATLVPQSPLSLMSSYQQYLSATLKLTEKIDCLNVYQYHTVIFYRNLTYTIAKYSFQRVCLIKYAHHASAQALSFGKMGLSSKCFKFLHFNVIFFLYSLIDLTTGFPVIVKTRRFFISATIWNYLNFTRSDWKLHKVRQSTHSGFLAIVSNSSNVSGSCQDLASCGCTPAVDYELQLEPSARRKGLGRFMMQCLEVMASNNQMQKLVLTVLKKNVSACSFSLNKGKI